MFGNAVTESIPAEASGTLAGAAAGAPESSPPGEARRRMVVAFRCQSTIIGFMSHNINPPHALKDTTSGKVAVFYGTDVKIHNFIDWIVVKWKTAGEFITRNPQVTRRHTRDYMLSVMPDRFQPCGEERDWVPDHEKNRLKP